METQGIAAPSAARDDPVGRGVVMLTAAVSGSSTFVPARWFAILVRIRVHLRWLALGFGCE